MDGPEGYVYHRGDAEKVHPDFYAIQRRAIVLAVIARKLEAKPAAALLSRLDKAQRQNRRLDLSALIPPW